MFEKITSFFFKAISICVHSVVIVLLFSIPVLFAYQSDKGPVFTPEFVSVGEVAPDDENAALLPGNSGDYYRIDYHITARSRKFSPYSFSIGKFILKYPEDLKYSGHYVFVADKPLEFSNHDGDGTVLSLYVEKTRVGDDVGAFVAGSTFSTRDVTRKFSFFKKEIKSHYPQIKMSEHKDVEIKFES